MANEEQLSILKQGADVWNKWRDENRDTKINLRQAHLIGVNLSKANLRGADLSGVNLSKANLIGADLIEAHLIEAHLIEAKLMRAKLMRAKLRKADLRGSDFRRANLSEASLRGADVSEANLRGANLSDANLSDAKLIGVNLSGAYLSGVDLSEANVRGADLSRADLSRADLSRSDLSKAALDGTNFDDARVLGTIFGFSDLSLATGLETVDHYGPSIISTNVFALSKGQICEAFLRGCGLPDWEIEAVKLYNPDLSNDEIIQVQYKVYDLRANQAIQISPLFISYNQVDSNFVNRLGSQLNETGVRYWRDIHDMKSGRIEKQIDRAIRQNPTVLLVLSQHSLSSEWVEHEVRTARGLEKELGRDVLCPVALDDSWKSSRWPKRIMEQIKEYNILDFSKWQDKRKFDGMFRKLIDGLELFYKG